jgi:hypothetical protein
VVVTPAEEPAVVEHEPLHSQRCRRVGEPAQGRQVVVEVDGLPGVQHHRAGPARVLGAVPDEPVQAVGETVETRARPRRQQVRCAVGLPRLEHDLTGGQQLAATEQSLAGRQPLGPGGVVAAPGRVHAPHLAGAEAEPAGAGHHQQRGVRPGAPAAAVAHHRAVVQRSALRCPFAAPAPGEVEQLGRLGCQRQRRQQGLETVVRGAVVAQDVLHPQHAGGAELDGDGQVQAEVRLDRRDRAGGGSALGAVVGDVDRAGAERRGPRGRSPPGDSGAPDPALRRLGQQADAHRLVEGAARHVRTQRPHQLGPCGLVEVAGVGAPVHDRREAIAVVLEQHRHPVASQQGGGHRVVIG